jgi:hypothetical protein
VCRRPNPQGCSSQRSTNSREDYKKVITANKYKEIATYVRDIGGDFLYIDLEELKIIRNFAASNNTYTCNLISFQ